MGELTEESEAIIKSLSVGRLNVPPLHKKVLFSTNDRVDIYNIQQTASLKTEGRLYTSSDHGNTSRISVPKVHNTYNLVYYIDNFFPASFIDSLKQFSNSHSSLPIQIISLLRH